MSSELEAELATAREKVRRQTTAQAVRERWVNKFRDDSPEWSGEILPPTQAENKSLPKETK